MFCGGNGNPLFDPIRRPVIYKSFSLYFEQTAYEYSRPIRYKTSIYRYAGGYSNALTSIEIRPLKSDWTVSLLTRVLLSLTSPLTSCSFTFREKNTKNDDIREREKHLLLPMWWHNRSKTTRCNFFQAATCTDCTKTSTLFPPSLITFPERRATIDKTRVYLFLVLENRKVT